MSGTGANTRVAVAVLIAQTLDEGFHLVYLVIPNLKMMREAAPGEDTRDLGYSRRTPNTGDLGTCEIMTVR